MTLYIRSKDDTSLCLHYIQYNMQPMQIHFYLLYSNINHQTLPYYCYTKILSGKFYVRVNTEWCRKANPDMTMVIPAYLRDILKMAVPVRRGLQECIKSLWHSFSQFKWLAQCWGVLGLLNATILRTTLQSNVMTSSTQTTNTNLYKMQLPSAPYTVEEEQMIIQLRNATVYVPVFCKK